MKFFTGKRANRALLRHKDRDACAACQGPSSGKERPPQDDKRWLKLIVFLVVLCASANCLALDREAFTFTKYDLNLQIEPELHRLGVRGKITLRNDSPAPQKNLVLQISSSLDWRSIRLAGKPLQFMAQPFASDIDHTGALSEAVVTLPQAVATHGEIELEIGYEGLILPDATRLSRIDTPEDVALGSDWDQIAPRFTGLRGAGYVAWYPIGTDVANLSEGNSLFDVLGRWKAREAGATMNLRIGVTGDSTDTSPAVLFNGVRCSRDQQTGAARSEASQSQASQTAYLQEFADCEHAVLGLDAPTLVIADYQFLERPSVQVGYFAGHEARAAAYADEAEKISPLITDWFGKTRAPATTAELSDPHAAPFESGALLLTPFGSADSQLAGLAAAHQMAHAAFSSARPWINEGLAHFAQALYVEQQKGRQSAIEYLASHRASLVQNQNSALDRNQNPSPPRSEDEVNRSLVSTSGEELYPGKAMSVWWMLRDMIGDAALKKALAAYRPDQDKEPSYVQRLIAAQTQRDLEWFFDDWVYRDRGLPDFKIESASPRKMLNKSFMVAVTVENLGAAGAEVPIIVKFAGGTVTKRLEVRGRSKATIRVETSSEPQEAVVNDGSVPESDTTNNVFKIEAADGTQ